MRYWAYINNEIKGPFEPDELIKIEGFSPSTLVCPQSSVEEETKEWKEAREIPELAIFTSSKLPTEKAQDLQTSQLQTTQAKEEIIIERFGIENLFATSSIEIDKGTRLSTDPLTLSQIRRKSEIHDESSNTFSKETKTEDSTPPNIIEEAIKEYKSQEIQEMPKETIEEFKIPSTDELLKTIENQHIIQDSDLPKEENQKNDLLDTTYEIKLNNKLNEKLYEFRKDILEEFNKIFNEKIEAIKKEFLNNLEEVSSQNNTHIQKLKNEILSEVETKLSTISQNQQLLSPNPVDNTFKMEFDELKNLVRHIEIEVRDLKAKTESIENKFKIENASLPRESLQKQMQPSFTQTSVNEPEENTKKDKKNNTVKTMLTLLLIPLSLGSIIFILKQFGIFDPTSFFISNNKKQEINQPQPPQPQATESIQNPTESSYQTQNEITTNTTYYSQPQLINREINNQEKRDETQSEISLESIINEVKDYKIKSPYNLERMINIILKSRKADLSSIKWEAQKKDEENKYLIIISAKAQKPIEFKFEYDTKTKLLQPLNTLSINTLKMMMEEKKETQKTQKPKSKQTTKQKDKNTSQAPKTTNKSQKAETSSEEFVGVLVDENDQTTNQGEEEEYLIIGE